MYIDDEDDGGTIFKHLRTIDDSASTIKVRQSINRLNANDFAIFSSTNTEERYRCWFLAFWCMVLVERMNLLDVRTGTQGDQLVSISSRYSGLKVLRNSNLQGTQGVQGTQGTQGDTGCSRNQGTQGTQGTQGIQGRQGTTGTQGIRKGTQGTQGVQGSSFNRSSFSYTATANQNNL